MKSLLIILLFTFFSGLSLSAQVYPGEYIREKTYLKFQGDSIGVWFEIGDQTVVITRNGQSRAIQADTIFQRGDTYIIQTPEAQYYIECWQLTVIPPLFTATFDQQVQGCQRIPHKILSSIGSYYVYIDNVTGENFRVEEHANLGFQRIWISYDAREFPEYLDSIARY